MLSLLFPVLLCHGPGLTANVDDPASHGTVGDSLLSLDEAIRLANGTLTIAQLSTAEQARLVGAGTMVETIVVDAMTTPVITLTAPLSDVAGMPGMPHHVMVMGMAPTGMPMPVLQGGSQTHVFALRTHDCAVHGLRIVGAQVAIDARMAMPAMPAMHMASVEHCELDGQTVAAVRLHGVGMDESMLMVTSSEVRNAPVGFLLDDQTAGGMVMLEGERVTIDGVALGCRVVEGGTGGNMSMCMLFRSTFVNGATLAEQRRTPTSAQQFMFRFVHTDATCTGNVLDIEGNAVGLTMIHHHHGDFVAGAGQRAFWCWPRTAEFDVHGSEMVFDGDVEIAANLATMRVWHQNNLYRNGTVTYDVDGALPNLLWNRFENCVIDVPAAARSPVVIRASHLDGTSVQSAAFLAPITLLRCWRSGGSLSGFATEQQTAPARFLGTTEVSPPEPQLGASMTLATDLPFGVGLVWDVALSFARPNTTLEPVRFYGDPATVVVLPALVLFQSQIVVPIPTTPALAGMEFYVQGISLPLLGQPWVPAYHLPRGDLVLLRP